MRIVLVTVSGEEPAAELSRVLLKEGLIACGNIVPGVRSIYKWKGKLQDEPEVLLVLKTLGSRVEKLLQRVPELHPYEVPEVLVLQIEAGHQPYLDWVAIETGPADSA